jgi:WD40 repeat protein
MFGMSPIATSSFKTKSVSWHPTDSKKIALAGSAAKSCIYQLNDQMQFGTAQEIGASAFSTYSIVWNPSGEYVATGNSNSVSYVYDANAPASPLLTSSSIPASFGASAYYTYSVSWSPDGKYLVMGNYNNKSCIYKIDITSDGLKRVTVTQPFLDQETLMVPSVEFLPVNVGGKYFIALCNYGTTNKKTNYVLVFDPATNLVVKQPIDTTWFYSWSVSWRKQASPDGMYYYLAVGNRNQQSYIYKVNASDGSVDASTKINLGTVQNTYAVAWSPDGRYILQGNKTQVSYIYEFDPVAGVIKGSGIQVNASAAATEAVAWSPDGQYIALGNGDAGCSLYSVAQILGQVPQQVTGESQASANPQVTALLERVSAAVLTDANFATSFDAVKKVLEDISSGVLKVDTITTPDATITQKFTDAVSALFGKRLGTTSDQRVALATLLETEVIKDIFKVVYNASRYTNRVTHLNSLAVEIPLLGVQGITTLAGRIAVLKNVVNIAANKSIDTSTRTNMSKIVKAVFEQRDDNTMTDTVKPYADLKSFLESFKNNVSLYDANVYQEGGKSSISTDISTLGGIIDTASELQKITTALAGLVLKPGVVSNANAFSNDLKKLDDLLAAVRADLLPATLDQSMKDQFTSAVKAVVNVRTKASAEDLKKVKNLLTGTGYASAWNKLFDVVGYADLAKVKDLIDFEITLLTSSDKKVALRAVDNTKIFDESAKDTFCRVAKDVFESNKKIFESKSTVSAADILVLEDIKKLLETDIPAKTNIFDEQGYTNASRSNKTSRLDDVETLRKMLLAYQAGAVQAMEQESSENKKLKDDKKGKDAKKAGDEKKDRPPASVSKKLVNQEEKQHVLPGVSQKVYRPQKRQAAAPREQRQAATQRRTTRATK